MVKLSIDFKSLRELKNGSQLGLPFFYKYFQGHNTISCQVDQVVQAVHLVR